MAYGSGYAGGYADAVADNITLAGAAQFAISQAAALTFGPMALEGSAALAIDQSAVLGLSPMAFAGQSDWAISQSADLVLPIISMDLEGTAAFQITSTGQLIFTQALAGTAAFAVATPNANLSMLELLLMGGAAVVVVSTSGTLFILRAPTLPPAKMQQALVKRRSLIMPYPTLHVPSGRPS